LAVRIIGKRVISTDQESKKIEYYISDGVYGSFNTVLFFHMLPGTSPLPVRKCHSEKKYDTTIWGPTCDSLDKVCTLTMAELDIGDWLWFDDMGSYTTSTSTRFNGYGTYVTAYYITESIR
jgi:ornithine decarboxylase